MAPDERPPCPTCQQPMTPTTPEVNRSRWWKCDAHPRTKTYLIHKDGWIVLRIGRD